MHVNKKQTHIQPCLFEEKNALTSMNLQICTKNKTTIGNNNVILKIIILTPP